MREQVRAEECTGFGKGRDRVPARLVGKYGRKNTMKNSGSEKSKSPWCPYVAVIR